MLVKNYCGAWIIDADVNGYLISRNYIGYTKKESIKMFKEFIQREYGKEALKDL